MDLIIWLRDYTIGVIRNPAFFLGLISFLGLVLQRKSVSEVISGTLKAIIGVMVLLVGVDIIIKSLAPISSAFERLFSIESSVEIADFSVFLGDYGSQIGMVMLGGFILNIVIARFTPLKTIFLTGHIIYWFAMLFVAIGVEHGLTGTQLVIFALVFQVLYLSVMPWLARPLVRNLTGDDSFTIGHTATIFCLIGDVVGRVVKKRTDAEDLNLPKSLTFFRDTTVTAGIVLFGVYFVVLLSLSPSLYQEVLDKHSLVGKDMLVISLEQGMMFAAGLIIILTGSRMMLSEIVPAFKGIADKIVPNAVPALDIPLIFPFGANSLLIGFIVSLGSSLVAIFVLGFWGIFSVALIPMTVACYFDVAPGSIFANKRGGVLAAIITGMIGGVLMIVLVGVALPLMATTAGTFIQAWGGNDFSLWMIISEPFARLLGS